MSKGKSAAATAKRAPAQPPAQPPLPLRWTQRLARNRTFWRDLGGLALIALGAITLLSVLGWNAGGIIATWAAFLSQAFGAGAVLLGVSMIAAGVPMVLNTRITLNADLLGAIIGAEVAFLALLGLIHSLTSSADGLAAAQSGATGGATGWVLARLVWDVLGSDEGLARLASIVFWLALFAAGAFMAARPLLMRRRLGTSAATRVSEPIVVIGRSPEEIAAESRHKPAPPAAEIQLQQPTKAPPAGVKSQPTIIRNEEKRLPRGPKRKRPRNRSRTAARFPRSACSS